MSSHYLSCLFEPKSVALIGASDHADKVGGRVLENLVSAGFQGRLFAVNPKYPSLRGIPCHASIAEVPKPVDVAIIVTPPHTVPGVIEECCRAGVRTAVVITAGFSEVGPEGAKLEQQLLANAKKCGMRVLGPNCLGFMRPPLGLNATFARGHAAPGSLALLSQSGALCTAMLDWAATNRIGFSSVISLGGSSDLDFGEVIDYLASDPKTEHILLYVEGVRDGRRLVSSLRAAARTKPVIVMKVGRHPAGSRAAVSHTGAIVGKDDVFDAVVRRTGIVRVKNAREMIAAAQALGTHVRPTGERLAIITNGGGPGVMAADTAADLDVPLANLSDATIEKLGRVLPPNWSHGNPIDLIGDAGPERYEAAVAACLQDRGVDGIVTILTPQAMTFPDEVAAAVIEASKGASKPVMACWMGSASVFQARVALQAAGIPSFRVPEAAVEAFAYVASFYRNQRLLLEAPAPLAHSEPPDLASARAIVTKALEEGRSVLGATESKDFLAAFGIPVARSVNATSEEETVAAAEAEGYPVVMKIHSPDITHKSDVGGVRVGIPNAQALREAYVYMMATVRSRRPDARVTGVSIERMVSRANGRELMAGITRDSIFGPAITFGAGGIAVEVLRDRAVALPPLNAPLAADLVDSTRVSKMLDEFRNLPAVDRIALEALLLRVSEIACEMPEVEELDINPIVADEHGVQALDARVVVKAVPAGLKRYGHLAIHPYPAELVTHEKLPDGTPFTLRPIRPEDAAIEMEFVDGLSPESRRMRFQSALRSLTPAMLARFTQIDYDREMAFIAVDHRGEVEHQVGVVRYMQLPDAKSCEFAVVVGDAWQGKGLGHRMMQRLIEVARARGMKEMIGWVLAANSGMLEMVQHLGFKVASDPEDPLNRRVTLDLA